MKLLEVLDQQDYLTGYYDPTADNLNIRNINDTRKPVLTLKALNRLKRMRALHNLEDLKHNDIITIMYGIQDDAELGGGLAGPGGF